MPQLEVAETNVVIGFVNVRADGEFFDHIPHHLERLAEVPGFIEADAHFQRGRSPLFFVTVLFGRGRFEVSPGPIIGSFAVEQQVPQFHVRVVANSTAWIAFDDRLPDLDRFGVFFGFKASVARFNQLSGGSIFDDGPFGHFVGRRSLGFLGRCELRHADHGGPTRSQNT